MKVFARTAFRYNGTDYPYGWQDLPQSLSDTLTAAGYVTPNDDPVKSARANSLADRPTAAAFGNGDLLIINTNYRIKCSSDGVSWDSHGTSDDIAYMPSAAALGKGSWQIVNRILVSDGSSYSETSQKYPTLKWDAALSKLKLGTGNAKVLFIGDSTETDAHANGEPYIGNLNRGWSRKLRALMTTPASNNSFIGNRGIDILGTAPTGFLAYNTRVTVDADWTTGFSTLGGSCLRNVTASTTSALHFLPETEFNTIDIYYATNTSSYGTFTVDIGAGVLATQNCIASPTIAKLSIPCTLGINTVNITKTTAGWIQIIGINCYKNNTEIQMLSAGYSGISATGFFQATQPNSQVGIRTVAPDLSVINLGINDSTGNLEINGFNTAYQSIIDTCLESGDVALCVPNVISNTNKNVYFDAIRALAVKNGLNLIDFDRRMGGNWPNSYTLGLMYDGRHPLEPGYQIMADEFYNSGVIAK